MAKNPLYSAKDLCKLIKTCAKYKVLEVQIGELRLSFGPKDKSVTTPKTLDLVQTRSVEQASQKIGEESQAKDRLDRISDDLEELKLTDPLAYEKLIGGELEDVGTS